MYKTVMDLVDDFNRFAADYGMQVKHFRLYRTRADRSREVVILFNPNYAGFAGDDQGIDPRYFVHIVVFEKGEDRMLAGDAPLAWYTEYRLDIRPLVADDFTLGVNVDGDILVMRVCAGVVYPIQEAPCLGNTAQYAPAFLHEGRKLEPSWFGLD